MVKYDLLEQDFLDGKPIQISILDHESLSFFFDTDLSKRNFVIKNGYIEFESESIKN